MKHAVALTLIALLAVPVALVLTFLLSPFWNWFETITGIESYGHSGPADWCFLAIYVTILLLSSFAWFLTRRKKD